MTDVLLLIAAIAGAFAAVAKMRAAYARADCRLTNQIDAALSDERPIQ